MPKKRNDIPPSIKKLIHKQSTKFTFKSSILRDLIVHQIVRSNGKSASLNTCRHYTNSNGVQPYEELYKVIKSAVQSHVDKTYPKGIRAIRFQKLEAKTHEIFKNKINEKIYAYTLKTLYKELTKYD